MSFFAEKPMNQTGSRWTYREQEPRRFVLVTPDGEKSLRLVDYFESVGNFVGYVFRHRGVRHARFPEDTIQYEGKTYPLIVLREYKEIVLTVNVTREDIENGVRKNVNCCAISHAVQRVLDREFPGGEYRIYTGHNCSYIYPTNVDEKNITAHNYDWVFQPEDDGKFNHFIDEFDEGEPVTPTRFRGVLKRRDLQK